ncbi:aminotransferase class I/II-fold pyridoxal phosphate-dependent enzyme [Streptomyces sp. NBC_01565]|uniref:aminotransferase class I/II-fold pyridoxal phosphate-dependent enzyme n=1 Tax=Streptomyces sp. NBC_01565 TaxID=2975881 RepID=UPI00224D8735|nr:aminotransferase class I/II-fold pyridoxal phosphate-dependent enzyme [Streptomyces sp. NBC_01565]MCX4546206.1 aminotransferase class I/II-fold pyridoxal phosphate-dependent enzyme [Streptomyces sp. NBC_01565]
MKTEFARRLLDLPRSSFATTGGKIAELVEAGEDVVNLCQGNPDLPTPPHIVEALRREVLDPATHRYPGFSGMLELKVAIAEWYAANHQVDLDPETEVAILFGAKAGLVEISQCFLNPGDVCLMPDPAFPDYWAGVVLARARMHPLPLLRENGFLPDYDALDPAVRDAAKLMFLNYPNNPTSVTAPLEFYERTVRFASEHDVIVASDFAYGALALGGAVPVSFLQAEGAKDVGVEFISLSKMFNMAGWRIGAVVGNRDVISAINLIQEHYYVSLPPFIQRAAVTALTGPQDCVQELSDIYGRRRDVFVAGLREAGWQVDVPKSIFAWLPIPGAGSSVAFADELLREAKVAVAPGRWFGEHGEGYVRVSLLAPEDRLREAVGRLAAFRASRTARQDA